MDEMTKKSFSCLVKLGFLLKILNLSVVYHAYTICLEYTKPPKKKKNEKKKERKEVGCNNLY